MRQAVIGIGSNSIRLLVAEVTDGRIVKCIHRGRQDARPFEGLVDGAMTQAMIERIVHIIGDFQLDALRLSAQSLALFATSATRDATNRDALTACILAETGLALRIISGDEEAALSFAGGALPGCCGLLDIGGGSTELIVGEQLIPRQAISLQLGAVRMQRATPITDSAMLPALLCQTQAAIQAAWQSMPDLVPESWVGVGGTCTTLAAMDAQKNESPEGHVLSRARVNDLLYRLSALSPAERAQLPGLSPKRVDIILPGTLILLACMQALDIEHIAITVRGNLDGFLLRPPEDA